MKAQICGSSIPHLDVVDVQSLPVIRLPVADENALADLAEAGSALLAKADLLENEIAAEAETVIDRFLAGDTQDVVVCPWPPDQKAKASAS